MCCCEQVYFFYHLQLVSPWLDLCVEQTGAKAGRGNHVCSVINVHLGRRQEQRLLDQTKSGQAMPAPSEKGLSLLLQGGAEAAHLALFVSGSTV